MTGSPIFFSNLRNRRNTSNWNYGMSIKNCWAIQKSCLDRESNAWFTLGSESESMVCDTTGSPIFFSNLRNRRNTSNWNYDMSIMICTLCPLRSLKRSKTCFFIEYLHERVCSIQCRSQVVTPAPWHLIYFLSSVTLAFGGKFHFTERIDIQ